jgi:hypothetical protein
MPTIALANGTAARSQVRRALRLRSPRETQLRSDTDVLLLRVGYQARTAHQEDVFTFRTDTQNHLLCCDEVRLACRKITAGGLAS